VTLEELQSALVELGLASDMSTVPEAREFSPDRGCLARSLDSRLPRPPVRWSTSASQQIRSRPSPKLN